jgi:hypothetical protein
MMVKDATSGVELPLAQRFWYGAASGAAMEPLQMVGRGQATLCRA